MDNFFAALDLSRAGLISLRWMSTALDYLDYLFRGFYLVLRRLSLHGLPVSVVVRVSCASCGELRVEKSM